MSEDTSRAVATRNPFAVDNAPAVQSGRGLISAEQQRAIAEVQARYLIARTNPRDPVRAVDLILEDCMRPTLAEAALYAYSRGGTDITGPTIRLAEAIARRWGNIASGIKELARQGEYSECIAYAHDLETGYYDERQFQVRHWRDTKKGGYRITEERDIYEAIANFGQRRKRAVLLSVIPGDVVDAAVEQCEATLHAKADTSPAALAKMVEAFRGIGVTKEQIEARCQRRIEALHPAQVVQLRKIFRSIHDGMSEAREWFSTIDIEAEPQRGNAGLRAAMQSARNGDNGEEKSDLRSTINQPTGRAGEPPDSRPAQPQSKGAADDGPNHPADDGGGNPAAEPAGNGWRLNRADFDADDPRTPELPPAGNERDEFWFGAKLAVQPVLNAKGNRTDWPATQTLLLRRIDEAQLGELDRLEADNHRTLEGLRHAYVGLYDEVLARVADRRAEFEGAE